MNPIPHEADIAFFDRELTSFVPTRVFDAHCHLHAPDHVAVDLPGVPPTVGQSEYRRLIDAIHPGRQVTPLYIPFPSKREVMPLANAWIAQNVAADPACRGLFFARPEDDPEWVRDQVRRLGLHGLKCYHTMAPSSPTWEADIPDYLPEPIIQVANEEGWAVTLHIVKSRAVADPGNIHWIRHYCETYPNMTLILAHSARGFQPAHNLEGLPQLTGLDNLYFDTSANCEPTAHEAIIRIIGHDKLMYGSDFYVSHFRGRSLAAADSFIWIYEESPVWKQNQLVVRPALVGLEHLRSLKWACWSAGLTDAAVEDIFYNNAARLFGFA
jgi:glutamate-1-semialdehyde 2,1-aminomutase